MVTAAPDLSHSIPMMLTLAATHPERDRCTRSPVSPPAAGVRVMREAGLPSTGESREAVIETELVQIQIARGGGMVLVEMDDQEPGVNRVEILRKWRRQGTGSATAKVAKHLRYRKAEVDHWLPEEAGA